MMGTLATVVLTLGFLAGLAMLFGFIANHLLPRSSVAKRAGIASVAVGVILTVPGLVAILGSGGQIVAIVGLLIGGGLLSAMSFPLALFITRRKPQPADPKTFD